MTVHVTQIIMMLHWILMLGAQDAAIGQVAWDTLRNI
jgi:hypothetical protein